VVQGGNTKPTSEQSHASVSESSLLPGVYGSEQRKSHKSHHDEIPIFGASGAVLKAVHVVVASRPHPAEVRLLTPSLFL
jgi:hypothetical protein